MLTFIHPFVLFHFISSLIINNSLNHGTQLPYIKRAQELGYSVLVTNTNDNYRTINGVRKPIAGLVSSTSHAAYVWENLVIPSEPESVAIVAHSAGGAVTIDLVNIFNKKETFLSNYYYCHFLITPFFLIISGETFSNFF